MVCLTALEDQRVPELGVVGFDFGFSSPFAVTVVQVVGFTCCLFRTQLGSERADGDIFGVMLTQGEFDESGVDG